MAGNIEEDEKGLNNPAESIPAHLTEAPQQISAGRDLNLQDCARRLFIHERVAEQAARTPEAPAAVFSAESDSVLSYAELERRAVLLARNLRARGVGPESVVAVYADPAPETLAALLGVLKAGAAYLPVAVGTPRERVGFMVEDAQVRVVLTQRRHVADLPEVAAAVLCLDALEEPPSEGMEEPFAAPLQPGNLAYVIYTSGSTGNPKGVLISHGSLLNLVEWHVHAFGVSSSDRATQVAGFGFDACVWEIWPYLALGACVYFPPPGYRVAPEKLQEWLIENAITISFLPTPLAESLFVLPWPAVVPLRTLLTGGDKLRQYPPASLPFALVNNYGPTEDTVVTTSATLRADPPSDNRSPGIGRPILNAQVYVLDDLLQPVPPGTPGQLCIGGAGLARGYLRRPGLTAEKFIPHPFSSTPGQRLYLTGDLACYQEDGSLEFLGRMDYQVKIRGFRIELNEIETCLSRHPAVREAVVVAREFGADRRLIAYVIWKAGAAATSQELGQFLRESLPVYMLPAAFVELDAWPLTPNGKIDRNALPAPTWAQPGASGDFTPPRTPVECMLADVWMQVLGTTHVSVHDNFFALGGHSLLATQVVSRLRADYRIDLPHTALFDAPTIAGLAELAETLQATAALQGGALLPRHREGPPPLSFAQQRLWFVEQLYPGHTMYTIPVALQIEGTLATAALEQALNAVVARHETLRTTIGVVDEVPVQIIAPVLNLLLPVTDLQSDAAPEQAALAMLQAEMARPFDLQRGPLLRVSLLRLNPQTHILFLMVHHIVFDGWSVNIFLRELASFYASALSAHPETLPPLPVQYADFAFWQREWLQGAALETHLAYWRQQLAGAPELLTLPTDAPRPPEQTFTGALRTLALPVDLTEALTYLGWQEGATLFMVLFSAFNVLLHHYTRQTDMVIGSPIANRTRSEIEPLIGFFVNMLPLRTDLTGDPSFRDLLKRVRETTLSAYTYQDLPFDRLVEALQISRELDYTPIFQVVFALQSVPTFHPTPDGLAMRLLPVENQDAQFDLSMFVEPVEGGLACVANYSADLFTPEMMERLLRHYRLVLQQIIADPDRRVSELFPPDAEDLRRLAEWNPAPQTYARSSFVHERVAAQALRAPEALAAVFFSEAGAAPPYRLTYAELDRRAARLAHLLHARGIGPESVIAVYADPSPEVLVALLGILKAGAAYLPVATDTPPARLNFMISDAQARVLLTQQRYRPTVSGVAAPVLCLDALEEEAAPGEAPRALTVALHPANTAYVIYTSGSTGEPKGVLISHESLLNLVDWHIHNFAVSDSDRATQVAGFGFDACVWEIWPYLVAGASVYFPAPEWRILAEKLQGWLIENAITLSFLPTPLAEVLMALPWPAPVPLRALLTGGDKLHLYPPASLPFVLVNNYGPTEDTVVATSTAVPSTLPGAGGLPSIGRPILNTQVYILDDHLQPAPIGIPGQLCIGGAGLARGYLRRPALTAEKFVPHPFSSAPGQRLYLTGDLARYGEDGNIEFMGRMDDQVKIRGFRIELGEIESTLMRAPGVREVALLVRDGKRAGKQLVAFVAPQTGCSLSSQTLREFLSPSLPRYMIPATFVILEALPVTPNGKVDRRALERLPLDEREMQTDSVEVCTPIEKQLCELWRELLGAGRVGIHDNFFELGGHSLLATQVISRLRDLYRIDLSLVAFFRSPTVAELAAQVESALESVGTRESPPLPGRGEGCPPLSYAQQRLWFVEQLHPGSTVYNLSVALHIEGALDVAALQQALNAVVARHEILRTTIAVDGDLPVQIIAPVLIPALPVTEVQDGAMSEREARAQALIQAEMAGPFDLQRGPLLRLRLLRLDPQTHILSLTVHHIVFDGWSISVFLRELLAYYTSIREARPATLPPLPLQYADFAVWQRDWLQGAVLESHLAYWRQQLSGAPGFLTFPCDAPRPPVLTFDGAQRTLLLSQDLAGRLSDLGHDEGATLFMVLFAAFNVLLHHYTRQTDLVVGSPIANRTRSETEPLIGFFVNMLALRSDLGGNPTFRDLLQRVRKVALEAYAHQDLPFEKLIEALHVERDPSYAPLFQLLFVLQTAPSLPEEREDLRLRLLPVEDRTAQFDVSLSVEMTGTGLRCVAGYNTALFTPGTVDRLLDHYQRVLRQIVADPNLPLAGFSLLDEREQERLLVEWNRTQRDYPSGFCLHTLFEKQAACTRDAVAAVWGGRRLTYRDLDRRANQLAQHLRALGAGPETLVALYMERGLEMLVGILGVLKSGAAYVPLDPHYPHARVAFILADTRAPLLLTQHSLAGRLPPHPAQVICLDTAADDLAQYPPTNLPGVPDDENLAYIIYTSGSTGTPKGVAIAHRSAVGLVYWALEVFEPSIFAGTLAATSVCFDLSIFEFFVPLSCGGTVILAENALQLPATPPITLINTVPSAIAELLRLGTLPASVRVVNSAGEPFKTALVQQLYALPHIEKVFDLYGPTEDTTYSTYALRRSAGPETIGRPIANTRVYLLDAGLNPVPLGVSGELYLGGAGLARGYLGRPGLTAEHFIPDPFSAVPGARLYRTGDLARYFPDGNLQFLGRLDHQVKVRGFRIELGEIEEQLLRHPAVEAAVMLVLEGARAGDQHLAAFVTSRSEPPLSPQDLRDFVQLSLPRYMIPAVFVILDAFPMTPNGKIDRRALAGLAVDEDAPHSAFVAPRTPLEEHVCELWQQLLGMDRVGIHDNFFALGGHSLLAIQLLNRLSVFLKRAIPLSVFFEAPTVALLVEKIVVGAFENEARTALSPIPHAGPTPLSFPQEQLWLIEQVAPGNMAYYLSIFLHIAGPLDCRAWEQALNLVIERHAVLRTTFESLDGNPVQIIAPSLKVAIPVVDMPDAGFDEVTRKAGILARQPFSLAAGPLLRGALYRVALSEHYFLLAVHHIVIDGWSLDILLGELAQAYVALLAGAPPALPEMALQYADFSVWQREWRRFGMLDRQLEYWTRQLAGAPQMSALPLDHPRPSIQTYAGVHESFLFPDGLVALLRALSRREGVSLFTLLLAAFYVLLYRYLQRPDIVVGVPVANRQHPEIENLIGYFVNTLAIRIRLDPDSIFLDALSQTRDEIMGAFACQEVPFQQVVAALEVRLHPSYNPLFQVMFNFLQLEEALPQIPGLALNWESLDMNASQFDLTLVIEEGKDRLQGIIEYNSDLFERSTVQKFQAHYLALLKAIVDDPRRTFDVLWDIAQIPLPQIAAHVLEALPEDRSSEALLRQRRDDLAARRARLSDEKRALLEKRLRGD